MLFNQVCKLCRYKDYSLPYVQGICIDSQTNRIFVSYYKFICALTESGELITCSNINKNNHLKTLYIKNDKIYCASSNNILILEIIFHIKTQRGTQKKCRGLI